MIKNIIDILQVSDFYGSTQRVEIAKGRYEYPMTWKSTINYIKRIWYGSRSNRS